MLFVINLSITTAVIMYMKIMLNTARLKIEQL